MGFQSMNRQSGSDHRQDADATTRLAFCRNALKSRMADSPALVAVLMGSTSDWETMSGCVKTLEELEIPNEAHVFSAHRTPDKTVEFVRGAAERGIRVII